MHLNSYVNLVKERSKGILQFLIDIPSMTEECSVI